MKDFTKMGYFEILGYAFNNYSKVIQNKGILQNLGLILLLAFTPYLLSTILSTGYTNFYESIYHYYYAGYGVAIGSIITIIIISLLTTILIGFLVVSLWYGIFQILSGKEYKLSDGIGFVKSNLFGIIKIYLWYLAYIVLLPGVIVIVTFLIHPGLGMLGLLIAAVIIIYYVIKLIFTYWIMIDKSVFGKKALNQSIEFTNGKMLKVILGLILMVIVGFLIALIISIITTIISPILPLLLEEFIEVLVGYLIGILGSIYYFAFYHSLKSEASQDTNENNGNNENNNGENENVKNL